MSNYRIQHTSKNDYIVRNQADNQLARFATETEAQAFIAGQQAHDAATSARREQAIADEQSYQQATPTLTEAQLTWQEWRNWFYGAMRWAAKDTAATQRALDLTLDRAPQLETHPSILNKQEWLTDAMREGAAAARLYSRAQELDTRIKNARRQRDTAALAEALAEAPALIEEMQPFFTTVGLPTPEPPKRGGTAPNTSLVLTDAELAFIQDRFGGSKSTAIHAALAALKRAEA